MHEFNRLRGRQPKVVDLSLLTTTVMLPLLKIKDKTHLLFEVRSKDLHYQPGEICFPGGRVEEHESPVEAAERETSEELGISRENIEIIGQLDTLVTSLGLIVYPFAGQLHADNISPASDEVESVFTVPIDFFLNTPPYITSVDVATRYRPDFPLYKVPSIYKEGWQKKYSYLMHYYEYENYFIWGLTGRILHNFLDLCFPGKLPAGIKYKTETGNRTHAT